MTSVHTDVTGNSILTFLYFHSLKQALKIGQAQFPNSLKIGRALLRSFYFKDAVIVTKGEEMNKICCSSGSGSESLTVTPLI